jgi:hypothetical protein
MKITYTTLDGRISFEFEASTQQDLFREIGRFQEVFENDAAARIGDKDVTGDDVRFVVRQSEYEDEKGKKKLATYYEKRVISGPMKGYKKEFGVYEDASGLFPRSKPPAENALPGYNGWYKYNPSK